MQSLQLTPHDLQDIARRRATCPFVGPLVATGLLAVENGAERPLARIGDVAALGDSGGGSLGTRVLSVFARGNHGRMPDEHDRFSAPVPEGFFSLDFPGSQGAHHGHSGILVGDPEAIGSGRFSAANFDRLAAHAEAGLLDTAAVGAFIAENVGRDPRARVLPVRDVMQELAGTLGEVGEALKALLRRRPAEAEHPELIRRLTRLAGTDNLVGSAGEFGLLFAFFVNRPGAGQAGRFTVPLRDLEGMMRDLILPEGWQSWPKRSGDWIHATSALVSSAIRAHLKSP